MASHRGGEPPPSLRGVPGKYQDPLRQTLYGAFQGSSFGLAHCRIYLLYWLLFKKRLRLTNHYHAEVFARDQEDGTLVRVDAGTAEYQKRLEEWVLHELGGQPMPHQS